LTLRFADGFLPPFFLNRVVCTPKMEQRQK
jgi:hypothetical protein